MVVDGEARRQIEALRILLLRTIGAVVALTVLLVAILLSVVLT